jgi:hypothetical protein
VAGLNGPVKLGGHVYAGSCDEALQGLQPRNFGDCTGEAKKSLEGNSG